jgi:hypothetical protein
MYGGVKAYLRAFLTTTMASDDWFYRRRKSPVCSLNKRLRGPQWGSGYFAEDINVRPFGNITLISLAAQHVASSLHWQSYRRQSANGNDSHHHDFLRCTPCRLNAAGDSKFLVCLITRRHKLEDSTIMHFHAWRTASWARLTWLRRTHWIVGEDGQQNWSVFTRHSLTLNSLLIIYNYSQLYSWTF